MVEQQSRKATVAGVLLGVGMGGFVDGIVLHQILQWHNMVSNWIPPTTVEAMRINMIWDGVFHVCVWLVTMAGILLFWSAAHARQAIPSFQSLLGQLVLGWGLFNLVEGVINHQILGIHYVRQVPEYTLYNLGFLGLGGVLLIAIGWLLMKAGRRAPLRLDM